MEDFFHFKKKYGQNFLKDKNVVNKIVNTVSPCANNLVIEIGCGDGRLTSFLCKRFDNVLGYEIDTDVKDLLFKNLNNYKDYSIIFDDFLNRDVISDLKSFKYDNLYVIANLPYYITTPIIEKIINLNLNINEMIFMVQKEVGDRFSSKPGSKSYGSLSVYLNYFYNIKKEFVVGRGCFIPAPNVDSVVVSFKNKEHIFLNDKDLFFKIVRDSFRFKRKTLSNNLKEYNLDIISNVLKKYNLSLSVRAEQLSVDIFCDIANSLSI